jgi:hypothetical protein
MRIDALHNLAIELEHKAQYAVRRRVLGPEIEGEIAQSRLGHSGLPSAAGSTPAATHAVERLQVECPAVFVATNFIVGRSAASAVASASRK